MHTGTFSKETALNTDETDPIRCIFLCEFHPTAGPIISCQEPDQYISKELFDSVSVYIITKAELERSTITVTLSDCKILGFPVRIEDKRYARNAYHFNLCFVCTSTARTVLYEPIVIKLSQYLTALEVEDGFLSRIHSGDDAMYCLDVLTSKFHRIRYDLNSCGECAVNLTQGPTSTHLKVMEIRPDPPPIADHQVPIFTKPSGTIALLDLTSQQMAPYIDGFNHVARISHLSNVEINLVKLCIQNLIYYGVMALLPIFQYSNVYTVTPRLQELNTDGVLQQECLDFVTLCQRHLPHFRDVFRLYASMSYGTTVQDLCLRYCPQTLHIDERKLVQFGILKGLVRHVEKYPILMVESTTADEGTLMMTDLQKALNGQISFDQICCAICMSSQQLDDQFEKDHNVVVLYK